MEFKESANQTRLKERPTTEPQRPIAAVPKPAAMQEPVVAPAVVAAPVKTQRNLFRAELIVYYLLGVVEVFLGIRLILALLDLTGAINNNSGFAKFIYNVTRPLCKPFYGLFNTVSSGQPGIGVIVTAMVVYGLIGWGIAKLFRIGRA